MDPHLKRLQEEISSVIAGLNQGQLGWHPPGKWCVAEVLEHLYLTYTGTTKGFSRVIASGSAVTRRATWTQRRNKFVVLGFSYLPSGRQAPPFARPRGLPVEKVMAEMETKITEMDDMIGECEKTLGRGKLLDHPILGPLTGVEWRKFHLVHGLHHVRQIRGLKKELAASGH